MVIWKQCQHGPVIEDQNIIKMFNRKFDTFGGMPEVVYPPSYIGSKDGILEVVDDTTEEGSLDSYMYFDGVEYITKEDFLCCIRGLLEKCGVITYNISIQTGPIFDAVFITTPRGHMNIRIPLPKEELSITRDYLIKMVYLNGSNNGAINPVQKLSQLELDMRNMSND